jgi:group II intron reverse transcriptase/maturase
MNRFFIFILNYYSMNQNFCYILIIPGFGRATVRLSLELLLLFIINVDAIASTSERHFTYPVYGNKQICSNARGTIACEEREPRVSDKDPNTASRAYDFIKMKASSFNLITFCGTSCLITNCLRRIKEFTCAEIPNVASLLERDSNNCEETGQSKTTLNKEQNLKRFNQPVSIPVKSPIFGDGRGFVVGLSPKGPMYLMMSHDIRRFHSTDNQSNKLDEVVIPREKVERLAKLWEASYLEPSKIYYDLKGYLKDINIWIIAYQKLAASKGATTPGVDNDTISETNLERLEKIQKEVLKGEYKWKPSRRKWIPKNNKGEKRPLGIPSFSDKLVEAVLLTILEPIYEFNFDKRSFGFRPERSSHSALKYAITKASSAKWAIEGDISKCFDKINHHRLLDILRERIKDELVLKLIKGNLLSPIYDDGKLTDVFEGTRQGGVLSPLLCNIYLDKLDKQIQVWEKEYREEFPQSLEQKPNKKYFNFRYKIDTGSLPKNTRNPYPQKDKARTKYLKMEYVRYADDFILFLDSDLETAYGFKEKLSKYLSNELNLKLNETKTKITATKDELIQFLGHLITKRKVRVEKGKAKYEINNMSLMIDIPKIIKKLNSKGFCDEKGFPIEHPAYIAPSQVDTNAIMAAVLNGYYEWFKFGKNRQKAMDFVLYIIRYSIAKTYAAKYKLGSMKKVYQIAGYDLGKPIRVDSRYKIVGLDEKLVENWKSVHKRPLVKLPELKYPPFKLSIQLYGKKEISE